MNSKLSKFILLLVGIGLAGSLYLNVQQHQQIQELQTDYTKKSETVKKIEKTGTKEQEAILSLESEIEKLKAENQLLKNNDKDTKGTVRAFQERTKKLFEGLTNFDTDTYANRKKVCEPYLSDELVKQYFTDSPTLGDANGTDSQMTDFRLYGQAVQGTTMKGLVVLRYESRGADSEWNKGLDFYEVEYNTDSQKVVALQYLGKGLTGDMLD